MKRIDSAKLAATLRDPRLQLVDLQSPDAYNGWRLCGEPRGGHIPGAKSLPYKWTEYLDWPDLIEAKEIQPRARLVLYGENEDRSAEVATRLDRMGFENISICCDFSTHWCTNPSLPLDRLPRYSQLIPPSYLHALLTSSCDDSRHILCHTYYRDHEVYEQGHIPGAVALDTELLESPHDWNRRSPVELEKALLDLGISCDKQLILYGDCGVAEPDDPFPGSRAGQLAAMRCAFIMLYAGVRDVRVLNGGLGAWRDAGYPTTTEPTSPRPVSDFGMPFPGAVQFAVDTPEAKQMLASAEADLVCVRSREEYLGQVSGYNYISEAGRIPGAVFANCGSDAYHMESYRNVDQTMRDFNEIKKMWTLAGIQPRRRNAFYCGTGWRGSEAFFYARLMGWRRVCVYDGGWMEWCSDPENARETGEPFSLGRQISSSQPI